MSRVSGLQGVPEITLHTGAIKMIRRLFEYRLRDGLMKQGEADNAVRNRPFR
jgi:hypothetical protein